ncbi:MAG TPA: GntR family transcriptional regulator [Chthoniobacter sp.]|jgi:DNA-binding GntR family transcriptional regulator
MPSNPLRDQAYKHIHGKLLAGDLPAGQVLSEHSLAREIGISRTPVREAIQRLEQEGVLEQVPRFGTIVRRPERRDLEDLYELREALEPYAVAQAANRLDEADLITLGRLCDEIGALATGLKKARRPVLDADEMRRLLSADLCFHMVLLRASGNRRLIKIIADSQMLTRIFGTPRQEHSLAVVERIHRFHSDILDSVKLRRGERARQLMSAHIRSSMREALEHYDRAQSMPDTRSIPLGLPDDLLADLQRIERGSALTPNGKPRARKS